MRWSSGGAAGHLGGVRGRLSERVPPSPSFLPTAGNPLVTLVSATGPAEKPGGCSAPTVPSGGSGDGSSLEVVDAAPRRAQFGHIESCLVKQDRKFTARLARMFARPSKRLPTVNSTFAASEVGRRNR